MQRQPCNPLGALVVILLPILSVFSVFILAEIAMRTYLWNRDGTSIEVCCKFFGANLGATTLDRTRGWVATENYRARRSEKTLHGVKYQVELSQDENGFRLFGKPDSLKPKVLVIGDSFTHAREVSNAKTYYARLRDALDIEVFAYGVEGYGTLQEYLALDRYLDSVSPDLIVWQYCFNDFINNDIELESHSSFHNNSRSRPYLIDGRIVQMFPHKSMIGLRIFASSYSQFLNFIMGRIDKFWTMYVGETLEHDIERKGIAHEVFSRAVRTTNELMARVRTRTGKRPIVAFNCKNVEPYNTALKAISVQQGIVYIDGIAQAIADAAEQGQDVFHADGAHWSEEGHRVVGEMLATHLKDIVVKVKHPAIAGSH